jgi:hypothetical protein
VLGIFLAKLVDSKRPDLVEILVESATEDGCLKLVSLMKRQKDVAHVPSP